jgi:predicted nuclease of restriction endonuclease-like (RecB) superfamily
MTKPVQKRKSASPAIAGDYTGLLGGISELLEASRRASARTVNAFMTATYWEVGRRIVEFEQHGAKRAEYGEEVLMRLADDLTKRLGRGFSRRSLQSMRQFYQAIPATDIWRTLSAKSIEPIRSTVSNESPAVEKRATPSLESGEPTIAQTLSAKSMEAIRQTPSGKSSASPFNLAELARAFPLPWSHYVLLISRSRSPEAFAFYQSEALRGGWSVRQLQRQMDSQFYERTALSRNKAAMLAKGAKPQPGDAVSADEEIRHPLVLEFLGLRDEYSETDLEEALIHQLETFLLELGNDFAFVGRQRRLRIDDEWYRVDLLFFHRRLRCLVIFDLKLGRFSHADALCEKVQGALYPAVRPRDVSSFKTFLPTTLTEQRRIVAEIEKQFTRLEAVCVKPTPGGRSMAELMTSFLRLFRIPCNIHLRYDGLSYGDLASQTRPCCFPKSRRALAHRGR